ncbi:Beta-glucosidase [Thalictrum thalictroides]|uniref:Beta-glucosidase n=1 Tax=Thalictrum thalictroides TaxID=46969 RepID=A0A7J6WH70_THATH|nr:Beta-glucosidase [Thalictrum thalictroides]
MFNLIFIIERTGGDHHDSDTFNRSSFPKYFVFGTSSSSYQYEGAYNEDGKGPSIWDTYTHEHPERIAGGTNGDVATDHYHRYKEDVALMKDIGVDAYKFSISWSRILPNGKLSGGVNRKGIQFYNDLINELLSKGLQPYVTLFHWDVPQYLDEEYGGFLSSDIVLDFQDYAGLCYKEFGDRVKHWVTLNEPYGHSINGYCFGTMAPGRCSKPTGNCSAGNSATEPYLTAHNQLLAHAAAVKVYKEKYQVNQKGIIGISLVCDWAVPFSETQADKDATQRAIDFMFGWFMEPLTYGTYPNIMQSVSGDRLPKFTKEESSMLKGSYDFIGLDYYTASYVVNYPFSEDVQPSYLTDCHCNKTKEKNGVPIGPKGGSVWLSVYPRGILDLLLYIKERYKNPTIYITENGIDEVDNSTLSLEEVLKDDQRIEYHGRHLSFALEAINEGVDLRGYFAWAY